MKQRLRKWLDPESRKLAVNTSWTLSGNLVKSGITFLRSVLVARFLGVESYGTYVLIAAFVTGIQECVNLSIGGTTIKFGADFKAENRLDKLVALLKASLLTVLSTSILVILIVAVFMAFFYDQFIEEPNLEWYILIFAAVGSTRLNDRITVGVMSLFFQFKQLSVVRVVQSAIDLIIVGSAVYLFDGLAPFFTSVVVAQLINSTILNATVIRQVKPMLAPYWKSPIHLMKGTYKRVLKFTLSNSLGRVFQTVLTKGDVVLLGSMLGTEAVAIYNIAKKLANLVLVPVDPVANTVYPQLSQLTAQNNYGALRKLIMRISGLAIGPCILIGLLAWWFGEDLIKFAFGDEYAGATLAFNILLMGTLYRAVLLWNVPMTLSLGRARYRLWANAIALVLGFIIAYNLIPTYGIDALAASLAMAGIVSVTILAVTSYHKVRIGNIQVQTP